MLTTKNDKSNFFSIGLFGAVSLLVASFTSVASESGKVNKAPSSQLFAAEAKSELKALLAATEMYQAKFTQVILDHEDNELQSTKGKISLAKPNKMRWQTMFPNETLLVADGNSVFNLDNDLEQVSIFSQNDIASDNPLMLLVSDDKALWDDVSVSKTSIAQQYVITSLNPDANIKSVLLKFSDSTLVSLESVDVQEQANRLKFSDINMNLELADSFFTINIPATFIVDDQRETQ